MISYIVKIIFAVCLMTQSSGILAKSIRVSFSRLSPHVSPNPETKSPQGPAIEYFKLIAKDQNWQIIWQESPIARQLVDLATGRIDIALLVAKTPHRSKTVNFPKAPFTTLQPAMVFRSSNAINVIGLTTDLRKLKVGYIQGAVINPWAKSKKINFTFVSGVNTVDRLVVMLASKRLDAVYLPVRSALELAIEKNGNRNKFKIINTPERPMKVYSSFAKNSLGEKLMHAYESSRTKIKTPYSTIFKKHAD